MAPPNIGILSPGDMGHSVGAVLRDHGLRVLTCLAGRSDRTRALAAEAGFEDVPALADLVQSSDILLSVLVPAAAPSIAQEVADAIRATQADLLYVDCNAIAPRTARQIGDQITAAGARFADAGIIGPPPRQPGTRIYTSGSGATAFATLNGYGLDIRILDGDIGQASGLKMCYGAMTKGVQALGTELLVAARALGLADALDAELRDGPSGILAFLARSVPIMPPKAHRWVGEMEEIAVTFADLGLTPNILNGAADLYRFVAATPIGQESPEERDRTRDLDGVIAALAITLTNEASPSPGA